MKTLSLLLAVALAFFVYNYLHRAITHPGGILVPPDPIQQLLGENEPVIDHGEFHLKPLARFSIDARVLHRKTYGYDRLARLAPIDLAVGWGPMSDQAVLEQIKITQSMRFY